MRREHVAGVVALQRFAFPPPFPEDQLWGADHLTRHIELFPEGQFVMVVDGLVVGSCSNTLISEERWQAHEDWSGLVGGPFLDAFDAKGSTLYGLDISVHPEYRRLGLGRRFYEARFQFVRERGLTRYGTGCRLPDYRAFADARPDVDVHAYGALVHDGKATDRTLTPLLRYGLTFLEVVEDYMQDDESANAAALLEWRP